MSLVKSFQSVGIILLIFTSLSVLAADKNTAATSNKTKQKKKSKATKKEALKDRQKPAPELEKELESFTGDRSPVKGSIVELRISPLEGTDDRYKVVRVNPDGPFSHFKEGQEVEGSDLPHSSEGKFPASISIDKK